MPTPIALPTYVVYGQIVSNRLDPITGFEINRDFQLCKFGPTRTGGAFPWSRVWRRGVVKTAYGPLVEAMWIAIWFCLKLVVQSSSVPTCRVAAGECVAAFAL